MSHFEKKNWILIFGSRLDSRDHGYVLLFVADHCESSYLICLQANSIKNSKSLLPRWLCRGLSFFVLDAKGGESSPWPWDGFIVYLSHRDLSMLGL